MLTRHPEIRSEIGKKLFAVALYEESVAFQSTLGNPDDLLELRITKQVKMIQTLPRVKRRICCANRIVGANKNKLCAAFSSRFNSWIHTF